MPLEELGADRARADRVDANALWGVLRRRVLAPVVQGRLAHRVVGVAERLKHGIVKIQAGSESGGER